MSQTFIGDESVHDFVSQKIGQGALILLRYGPGSGGNILLKELLKGAAPGSNGIYLSTFETLDEIASSLGEDHNQNIEIRSMLEQKDRLIERTVKRDRFMSEGIMVTDLLEISMSERPISDYKKRNDILSRITSSSSKQVLPFTLVFDSLDDLLEEYDASDISTRLIILKRAIRAVGGIAVFGTSLNSVLSNGSEVRLFDCLMEAEAVRDESGWHRRLRILHRRDDPSLPMEWELHLS